MILSTYNTKVNNYQWPIKTGGKWLFLSSPFFAPLSLCVRFGMCGMKASTNIYERTCRSIPLGGAPGPGSELGPYRPPSRGTPSNAPPPHFRPSRSAEAAQLIDDNLNLKNSDQFIWEWPHNWTNASLIVEQPLRATQSDAVMNTSKYYLFNTFNTLSFKWCIFFGGGGAKFNRMVLNWGLLHEWNKSCFS